MNIYFSFWEDPFFLFRIELSRRRWHIVLGIGYHGYLDSWADSPPATCAGGGNGGWS